MTQDISTPVGQSAAPWHRISQEIDLPILTATWVLTAHVLTILSPVLLIAAVASNRGYLDRVLDRPDLLYVGGVVLIVASVCESAQNTLDKWYLVGTPPSLLDFLFNSLVVLSLAINVIAVAGASGWVWGVALAGAFAFSLAYLVGWPTPPIQAALGLASAYLLSRALSQPVIILGLTSVFLTLYFLDILIRTRQQVMHGFVTLINAVGLMATVIAIVWSANHEGMSWPVVIGLGLVIVGGAFVLRPVLLRLGATPHKQLP